jgi:hypothetical protein
MGLFNKKIALALAAVAACGAASASEDYDLRYAPGIGGADMSAPFEGGWVFQAPAYVYSGHVKTSSEVQTSLTPFGVPGGVATTTVDSHTQINVWGLLPRLSYMSSETFLGATVGGTALLPLLTKRNSSRVTGISTSIAPPGLPAAAVSQLTAGVNAGVTPVVDALAAANTNANTGIGDVELSPILRWAGETSQTLAILTLVLPTGDYEPGRAANPGAGAFYTLRPAVQYSYIGEGWDVGARAAYSMNTRNVDTRYHTGNYLNVDATLMKSLTDSMRVGVSGYAVMQTTRDSVARAPDMSTLSGQALAARQEATEGDKGHVLGAGPEFAYIHGSGDFLLDGRFMKEFSAKDRPDGFTAIVTLSKPF